MLASETETGWTDFRKSTFSGNGGCVEVSFSRDGSQVRVRDTKQHGEGPTLTYSKQEWEDFVKRAHAGEVDMPAR